MTKEAAIKAYIDQVNEDRKEAFLELYDTVRANIPAGFEEQLSYGSIGFVVPKSIYPQGYHCTPELPLPFVSIASQKSHIALYHMGIYMMQNVLDWFVAEYPKHSKYKLDMGKSCIRFKRMDAIPYALIAELMRKITVDAFVNQYEKALKRS